MRMLACLQLAFAYPIGNQLVDQVPAGNCLALMMSFRSLAWLCGALLLTWRCSLVRSRLSDL